MYKFLVNRPINLTLHLLLLLVSGVYYLLIHLILFFWAVTCYCCFSLGLFKGRRFGTSGSPADGGAHHWGDETTAEGGSWMLGSAANILQGNHGAFHVNHIGGYPLVNVYITMENHHFSWENPL